MPITDPSDEHFKGGLWGWVTNTWKKLIADVAGHLQVDVVTSDLPTGAATAANQTTMITALQLIDDLRNALNDVAADELRVLTAQYGTTWKVPRADTDGRLIVKAGIDGTTPEMLNVDSAGTLAVTPAKYGAAWETLRLDVNDNLRIRIDAQNIDVEVKQQTPADLTPGICGWDGSAWHKLPLLWGYSAHYCEDIDDTASGTENATAIGQTVPVAQQVWIIEAMALWHDATADNRLIGRLYNNSTYINIFDETVAPETWTLWSGSMTLPPGGNATGIAVTPGDGKKVRMLVWGYKMNIAQ